MHNMDVLVVATFLLLACHGPIAGGQSVVFNVSRIDPPIGNRSCFLVAYVSMNKIEVQASEGDSELTIAFGDDNSASLVTVTRGASRTFGCKDGKWELMKSFALLVDPSNTSFVLGNYTYSYNETSVNITGQWSLYNNMEDMLESGLLYLIVSGKVVYFLNDPDIDNVPNQLVQITNRNFLSTLKAFSYVQVNGTGGAHPSRNCIGSEMEMVEFDAQYTFYTQDLLPPPTSGLGLSPPKSELPLQSLFVDGTTQWIYKNSGWEFVAGSGSLWDIPGGQHLGSFTITPGYTFVWQLFDPNGFVLIGDSIRSTSVSLRDWPWQLYRVTSFTGSLSLGKRSFVQLVSTSGGLPPISQLPPTQGATYASQLSAVSWIYTKLNTS